MKITYGGTWSTELMWSLIWILSASWYGIWLRTRFMKRQRLGVYVRRTRSRGRALGDHEIVTAPKYFGKWLVDENKWRRAKQPHQKQI